MKYKPKKRPRAQVSPTPNLFLIEGLSPLKEYLKQAPKAIKVIYYRDGEDKRKVEELLRGQPCPCPLAPLKEKQEHFAGAEASISAQIEVHPKSFRSGAFDRERNRLVLVIDHITDARNLGAIARSAAFFGVSSIIVPSRRQALLTQGSISTSQGAFAYTDLLMVPNISRVLEQLKELGYWVIGAALEGEPLSGVRKDYDYRALVLGSEDKGISRIVRRHCDLLVRIPGVPNGIDSLNVSVAAGVMLHELNVQASPCKENCPSG